MIIYGNKIMCERCEFEIDCSDLSLKNSKVIVCPNCKHQIRIYKRAGYIIKMRSRNEFLTSAKALMVQRDKLSFVTELYSFRGDMLSDEIIETIKSLSKTLSKRIMLEKLLKLLEEFVSSQKRYLKASEDYLNDLVRINQKLSDLREEAKEDLS